MTKAASILEAIGNTPHVKINRLFGDVELQPDGSLQGEICYRYDDEYSFIVRK